MAKYNISIKNFGKHNTPRWAEQIGNGALLLGGMFASVSASCAALEVVPADVLATLPFAVKTINFGKVVGAYGAMICGGVKSVSKLFGIPLKDIH
jgi:hypothetical protein